MNDPPRTEKIRIFLATLMMYIIIFSQKKQFENDHILNKLSYKNKEFLNIPFYMLCIL